MIGWHATRRQVRWKEKRGTWEWDGEYTFREYTYRYIGFAVTEWREPVGHTTWRWDGCRHHELSLGRLHILWGSEYEHEYQEDIEGAAT